jgi:hypothetical protein
MAIDGILATLRAAETSASSPLVWTFRTGAKQRKSTIVQENSLETGRYAAAANSQKSLDAYLPVVS